MEYKPNPELERLKAEKEKNEKEIEQINHKITRLENRQKYFEDGERKRRTHRLCTIAGTLESIVPEIKELDITEVMELLEHIFQKEEIQKLVHRMKINHDSKVRRAKEGNGAEAHPVGHGVYSQIPSAFHLRNGTTAPVGVGRKIADKPQTA